MHSTIFYFLQTKQPPLNEAATKPILIFLIVVLTAIVLITGDRLFKAFEAKSEDELFKGK